MLPGQVSSTIFRKPAAAARSITAAAPSISPAHSSSANKAPNGSGGAIYSGGSEELNVAGTIFSGNTAKIDGGAISASSNTVLTDVISTAILPTATMTTTTARMSAAARFFSMVTPAATSGSQLRAVF
ncbi:MAG: hypothetical protein HC822_22345 [Oscillochloris sp.]|nr:hypothetical protein [Oscillochloris sp.]